MERWMHELHAVCWSVPREKHAGCSHEFSEQGRRSHLGFGNVGCRSVCRCHRACNSYRQLAERHLTGRISPSISKPKFAGISTQSRLCSQLRTEWLIGLFTSNDSLFAWVESLPQRINVLSFPSCFCKLDASSMCNNTKSLCQDFDFKDFPLR